MSAYSEIRSAIRNQLFAYIQTSFTQQLVDEFKKYESNKYHFSFKIDELKWSIVTGTKIKYSSNLGWEQDDNSESIEHIRVGIMLNVNGKLAGEFMINFSTKRGFYNIESCVKKAIHFLDLNNFPEPKPLNEFSIQNIMKEQYVIDDTIDSDPRIPDIVIALTSMNYGKRKAEAHAKEIIKMYPDIHDIDTLVNEIICRI